MLRNIRRFLVIPILLPEFLLGTLLATRTAQAQSSAAPRAAAARITVTRNVRVSANRPSDQFAESWIAADPTNAQRLVGMSFLMNSSQKQIIYTSHNGGLSWAETLVDPAFSGEPSTVFGPDGSAYASALAWRRGGQQADVHAWYSTDGGMQWTPSRFKDPQGIADRSFMTADTSRGPYRGRVYISGSMRSMRPDGKATRNLGLYRSEDGGRTYESPVLMPLADDVSMQSLNNTVLSDGTVLILGGEYKNGDVVFPLHKSLKVIRSADGGHTLETLSTVAQSRMPAMFGLDGWIASDHSDGPFKDRVYVAWRSQVHTRQRIMFAYSTDKGKNWSTPRMIDDAPDFQTGTGPDSCMEMLAVSNLGVVGIAWEDRREDPNNQAFTIRFTASLDGGESWLRSVRVSDAPSLAAGVDQRGPVREVVSSSSFRPERTAPRPGAPIEIKILDDGKSGRMSGGDTSGLDAGADGRFHLYWADNRTRVLQLWSSTVTVEGKAADPAAAVLQGLSDVTDRIAISTEHARFYPSQNEATLDLRVRNISDQPLKLPLSLRIGDLTATHGTAIVVLPSGAIAEHRVFQAGANAGPVLAPHDVVVLDHLTIRIPDRYPVSTQNLSMTGDHTQISEAQQISSELLKFTIRVFARIGGNPE